ncbi:MAG: recombinase family protein [Candidatus Korobacteraceae bacterium]
MSDRPKRAALYARVSTFDQHPETQLLDLRQMAAQRGYEIVGEYSDTISGAKQKRPGLDQLMTDARRGRFDVVLVAAFDRVARSTRHFLEVLDELNHLKIEFVSFRENVDTGGPLGRAMTVIMVRAGMRRARLEGIQLGRKPLNVDRAAIVHDRLSGMSLTAVAKKHGVSRGTVCRLVLYYVNTVTYLLLENWRKHRLGLPLGTCLATFKPFSYRSCAPGAGRTGGPNSKIYVTVSRCHSS